MFQQEVPQSANACTKTLLFTDMIGSTDLWVAFEAGMLPVLQKHNEILQSAIEQHGGKVFGTAGDAYYAAFDSPLGAVKAALTAHQNLQWAEWDLPEQIQIRSGIHTGVVYEADGNYFGKELSLVARIMSAAHPRQTLVSEATRALLDESDSISFLLLGSYELKGLKGVHPVYQVNYPGFPDRFPPLEVKGGHNLPAEQMFIGREADVNRLMERLESPDVRLLTLFGGFGQGKTSLALRAAHRVKSRFRHGAWWIDLTSIQMPEHTKSDSKEEKSPEQTDLLNESTEGIQILDKIAITLGVETQKMLGGLLSHCENRNLLLVLDNCEHLLDSVRVLSHALLSNCPQIKILATSRTALHVREENLLPVRPLDSPSARHQTSLPEIPLEAFAGTDAAQIFVYYASRQSDFRLAEQNQGDVARLCQALDGNLLAIELTASLVRSNEDGSSNLPTLLKGLGDILHLAKSRDTGRSERQSSLEAAIEYSYRLLSENEQRLFCRLSHFAGEWSHKGAMAVCKGTRFGSQVTGLLESLSDKSMIVPLTTRLEPDGEGEESIQYYRLLESMKAFGREQSKPADMQRVHTLAAEYYYKELAQYVEQSLEQKALADIDSLQRFYYFDDPDWLRRRREWLYHSAFSSNRAVARIQFLNIFLSAFWWWDEYLPFPFCEEILDRWKRHQTSPEDRELWRILHTFRENFPRIRQWKTLYGHPGWEKTLQALQQMSRIIARDMAQAGTISRSERVIILGLRDVYIATACSLIGEDADDAEENYEKAIERFQSAIDSFKNDRDMEWSVPYVLWSLAEHYLNGRDGVMALDCVRQGLEQVFKSRRPESRFRHHTESRRRLSRKSDTDYEVEARLYRVLADIQIFRAESAKGAEEGEEFVREAFDLYLLALWTAYLFQYDPHPSDHYNAASYQEYIERIADRLTSISRFPEYSSLIVQMAQLVHAFWSLHTEPFSDDVIRDWLKQEDAAALQEFLGPPPATFEDETLRALYQREVVAAIERTPVERITRLTDTLIRVLSPRK